MTESTQKLEKYKELLDKTISYYFPNEISMKYFNRIPESRYYTFKYCLEEFEKNNMKTIVELGTTRSFVDGRFEGCNDDNKKYWEPQNPEKWDWSAGCFTRTFNECLSHISDLNFHTVDLASSHIERCKFMNKDFSNIKFHVCSSEDFLKNVKGKIDLLYLDTGDMTPIEPTAQLHLREAKIIVQRDLLSDNGIILIDDIRSCVPYLNGENKDMGKGYLSIPYFLENGYEVIMDEYQTIIKKKVPEILNRKKVLHLSFHKGCQNDIEYICNKLNFDLEFKIFDDGISSGNSRYNISKEKANMCWEKYKDYFNTFDVIITSDTAPISRVFLQNDFKNQLIIWVCNRFDYFDASSLDCDFPDKDYYTLIRNVKNKPNVSIIGYTPFENIYAKIFKNVDIGEKVIKPIGKVAKTYQNILYTNVENKQKQFFVPPYHNDNIMMNLCSKLNELNIPNYNNRYNGPLDLKDYKGIIHIPYAWSNLALFENFQQHIVYFIPSINFLNKIRKDKNFFWSPPFSEEHLNFSEWYHQDHQNIIVYFDSWEDLKYKTENTDFKKIKNELNNFCKDHEERELYHWRQIFFK